MKLIKILILVSILLINIVYAEEQTSSGMLSSPEAKASILKNSINTVNNVNLATGEYQVSYTFPPFESRGGASFNPTLTYNPSYTSSRQDFAITHYDDVVDRGGGIIVGVTEPPFKEHFSWVGNGWNINPFGYISLEKVIKENEAEDQHRLVLPDGTSSRLILIKKEYSSVGDASVPDWNTDTTSITEYQLESFPYYVIKRYRTISFVPEITSSALFGTLETLGRSAFFKDNKWFIQSPDNSKFYFEHAQVNKKVFSQTPLRGPTDQYTGWRKWIHYYPFYNKWDITKWIPNGNEENAVYFDYEDIIDHLNLGYDNYRNDFLRCKEAMEAKGERCESGHGLDNAVIKLEYLGDTSYISESYPRRIYGQDTQIDFFGKELDNNLIYKTNFKREGNDWNFFCEDDFYCDANKNLKVFGRTLTTALEIKGNQDSKWGAYRIIENLEPFTSYVIKTKIAIPVVNAPRLEDCRPGHLNKVAQGSPVNSAGGSTNGYFALIRIDARSLWPNDPFPEGPKAHFLHSKEPANGLITGGLFLWSPLFPNHAMYQYEEYNINCWNWNSDLAKPTGLFDPNAAIDFTTTNTFSTTDETTKVIMISGYNVGLRKNNGRYINPIMTELKIEKVPRNFYLNRVIYKKGGKTNAIFDLDYEKEGTNFFNLKKVQQLSLLSNSLVAENSIPGTSFEYTGRILNKVNLPTQGFIEFNTQTNTHEFDRPNSWYVRYRLGGGNINVIGDSTRILFKKYYTAVNQVRLNDNTQTLELEYNYENPYWEEDKETFFVEKTIVTNNEDDGQTEYDFYPAISQKELRGKLRKTTITSPKKFLGISLWKKTLIESESEQEVFKGYPIEINGCSENCLADDICTRGRTQDDVSGHGPSLEYEKIRDICNDLAININSNPLYQVRETKTITINYDKDGRNPKTIQTEQKEFDDINCGLSKRTEFKGFVDNSEDDRYSISTYTEIENGNNRVRCLPLQQALFNRQGIEQSRTTTTYYNDINKIGLTKELVKHNLQDSSRNLIQKFDYDQYRNTVSIKDALDRETTITFDDRNHKYIIQSTNALGQIVSLEYDTYGRIVSFTDENGNKKYSLYDDLNRLCKVQDVLGRVPEYIPYDATGICQPFDYQAAFQQYLDSINSCSVDGDCNQGRFCDEGHCISELTTRTTFNMAECIADKRAEGTTYGLAFTQCETEPRSSVNQDSSTPSTQQQSTDTQTSGINLPKGLI